MRPYLPRAAGLAGLLVILLAASGGSALAAEADGGEALPVPAESLPPPEFNALMTFVAANPDCQNFTDDCQICRRLTQHQIACSTPGIACQRGTWRCQGESAPVK